MEKSMSEKCNKLKEFMSCQLEVIQRHIDEHKWLNGIEDKDKAVNDFVKKFGWIIRELYCLYSCSEKDKCNLPKITLETKKYRKD